MGNRYQTDVLPVKNIPDDTIRQMEALYLDSFDGSSSAIFREDLADKDEVILLRCDRALSGFTALKAFDTTMNGRRLRVVYSGDTIVAPRHYR